MVYVEIENITKTEKQNEICVHTKIYFQTFLEKFLKMPTVFVTFYIAKTDDGKLKLTKSVGLGNVQIPENKFLEEETANAIRKKYKEIYGVDF